MNPDSPLRVSKKGGHQDAEIRLQRSGGAYRKTLPTSLLGTFLPVGGTLREIGAGIKVPGPEPPGTNWDKLGWAK